MSMARSAVLLKNFSWLPHARIYFRYTVFNNICEYKHMFATSSILFIVSALLLSLLRKTAIQRAVFVAIYALYSLLLLGYFVIDYFTGTGITPGTLYTLQYGLWGAGFLDYLRLICGVAAILILAGIFIWLAEFKCMHTRLSAVISANASKKTGYLTFAASLALNPLWPGLWYLHAGTFRGVSRPGLQQQKPQATAVPFSRVYLKPELKNIPKRKYNLVYIYAESLERTYLDEHLFPDLLPGIKKLEQSSVNFTGIEQLQESWWTMGGMVASQCGMPLALYSGKNSFSGASDFLPRAVCIGDLLHGDGYSLAYMGGARIAFAGKGKFYRGHGFDEASGFEELKNRLTDSQYRIGWGIYDDTLFDLAYEKFMKMGASGGPFGLFMLTLDTHMPGYVAQSCGGMKYGDGSNRMLNAVHCDDKLISSFVDKLRSSPYGKDTVIVIASDHIAMRNSAYAMLEKGDRKNMLMILPPPGTGTPHEVKRSGTPFDIGPTILHELGYNASLGLGRNLEAEDSLVYKTSVERHGFPSEWVDATREFWALPEARDIVIDGRHDSVLVNGSKMSLPLLMELDKSKPDKYYFGTDDERQPISYLVQFPENALYVYIDRCSKTYDVSGESRAAGGWCFVAGKMGSGNVKSGVVLDKAHFAAYDIDKLYDLSIDSGTYIANIKKILDAKMYSRVRAMLDSLPDGSAVFISNPNHSAYARAYVKMLGKAITVYNQVSDLIGRQFYTLDYELTALKDPKFSLRYIPLAGKNGVVHISKFVLRDKAKLLIANPVY